MRRSVMQRSKTRTPSRKCCTPQLDLPAFARNTDLLKLLDSKLRRNDALDELIAGLDQYQQTAFNLLRSKKLRQALDLSQDRRKSVHALRKTNRRRPATPSAIRCTFSWPAA